MADLDWRGLEVIKDLGQAKINAVRASAHYLRGESIERTPLETGTLRNSAKVSDNGDDEAAVSYNTPYAARQHEELGYAHPGGGQAKFLESAALDNQRQLQQIAAEQIRKSLGL